MSRRIPHCHTCWKPVKGHSAKTPCQPAQLDMFSGADGGYVAALQAGLAEVSKIEVTKDRQGVLTVTNLYAAAERVTSWLDIHRAQYADDPRREPDCGGCEYFGLCAAHSILAVDDAEGRARSKRKEPRAIEEEQET